MKKIYEALLKKQKRGDVGIEIETEGRNLHIVDNDVWTTTDDGSLRGVYPESRAEFVLRNPIPVDRVYDAILSLQEELDESEINFSFRTSVHVHVNVQQLTFQEAFNMMYLYMLIEEPLIQFCGKNRVGNRFCLRIRDSDWLVMLIRRLYIAEKGAGFTGEYVKRIRDNDVRYAALNLAALNKYGSIEFRGMEGTIDPDLLQCWSSSLVNIREAAKQFKNLQEISDCLLDVGAVDFFYGCVGAENAQYYEIENFTNDIMTNHSLTYDLIHI